MKKLAIVSSILICHTIMYTMQTDKKSLELSIRQRKYTRINEETGLYYNPTTGAVNHDYKKQDELAWECGVGTGEIIGGCCMGCCGLFYQNPPAILFGSVIAFSSSQKLVAGTKRISELRDYRAETYKLEEQMMAIIAKEKEESKKDK